jgi:hypothetical protein
MQYNRRILERSIMSNSNVSDVGIEIAGIAGGTILWLAATRFGPKLAKKGFAMTTSLVSKVKS